jgi:hypothetical protein
LQQQQQQQQKEADSTKSDTQMALNMQAAYNGPPYGHAFIHG